MEAGFCGGGTLAAPAWGGGEGACSLGAGEAGGVGPLRGVGYRGPPLGAGRNLPREGARRPRGGVCGVSPAPPRPALPSLCRIYWGCFYFFPWLRMWRRERR